jgi:hypothetical protein
MKAGRGSAVLVQLIVLYMPSHNVFNSSHIREGEGGIIFPGYGKAGSQNIIP